MVLLVGSYFDSLQIEMILFNAERSEDGNLDIAWINLNPFFMQEANSSYILNIVGYVGLAGSYLA